ncbi:MAG: hypothetical protein A2231_02445 [Candidatus Firestonebacteria bacterium RIFOXYA2_FULL_40_8]|nr:MAG: hypothetical protein A2231_02445 [Candidatus Firestonebacteria bacterium RIFOXYA2_FULL_40_8]
MKICVFGLWHLGTVVSNCLAKIGHDVAGLDFDKKVIAGLNEGKAPLFEPGLDYLLKETLKNGKIRFTSEKNAVKECEVLWIAFDTPVDADDNANVEFVEKQILSVIKYLKNDSKVVISSQVPAGFTRKLKNKYAKLFPGTKVYFACSPENLRLGKAIKVFMEPDRIIIGTEKEEKIKFEELFLSISSKLEWMGIESAEMTKHAINAFLAAEVSFANELGTICEQIGADMKEVERGLKTEERIGPKAYLKAGTAFSGGTLARDIRFLSVLGDKYKLPLHLIRSVKKSNDEHKNWIQNKCKECLGGLKNKKIAILGLTYKPGTDTLRRSLSVELCKELKKAGAVILAFDPAVKKLPADLSKIIKLCGDIKETVKSADCVVISTEWPFFREMSSGNTDIIASKHVIDANGFMKELFKKYNKMKYYSVGGK